MAENFLLEIITPSTKLLSKEVDVVTAPGEIGEFGVFAGHTDFFTLLKAGTVMFKTGSQSSLIAVSRGYAEVGPERTTLLVDAAVPAEDIDASKAREELKEAEAKLEGLEIDDPARRALEDAVDFAEARLRIKEGA